MTYTHLSIKIDGVVLALCGVQGCSCHEQQGTGQEKGQLPVVCGVVQEADLRCVQKKGVDWVPLLVDCSGRTHTTESKQFLLAQMMHKNVVCTQTNAPE